MSLVLDWNNEQNALDIGDELIGKLKELLRIAAEAEGVEEGEVVLSFVDDETIRQLNLEYRNIDKATDVLSFSMLESGDGELDILYGEDDLEATQDEDGEPETLEADDDEGGDEADEDGVSFIEPLGDIVISVPTAIAQAEEYGHSIERELGFLFVHGFLHLLGYDHEDEAAERAMFDKQEAVLQKAGLRR